MGICRYDWICGCASILLCKWIYAMPYRKGRDSSCYNFSNVYLSNGCWVQKQYVLCLNHEACLDMVIKVV